MTKTECKNRYFLYITGLVTPVIESQVFNFIKVLQNTGIVFDVLMVNPIITYLRDYVYQKKQIRYYKEQLYGRIYRIFTIKTNEGNLILVHALKAFYILTLVFFKAFKTKQQITIQVRSDREYLTLKYVKFFCPEIQIIVELRGLSFIEYLDRHNYGCIKTVDNETIRHIYNLKRKRTYRLIEIADKIIVVSDRMKDFLMSDNEQVVSKANQIFVIPGAADSSVFKVDFLVRERIRKELEIADFFVITYSGGLDGFYHKKELIFDFVAKVQELYDNVYFLCITQHYDTAYKFSVKYGLKPELFKILSKSNSEIGDYLNASDVGLIFRDNILTNSTASPTKIPEYLLTGLPVIISDNVGDYSAFVKSNNFGLVVSNDLEKMVHSFHPEYFKQLDRNTISSTTQKFYSKQSVINKLLEIYCNY